MKLDTNYKVISKVPKEILDPIIFQCSDVNWNNGTFNRFEKPLADGKLLEFPFPISKKSVLTNEQQHLLEICNPILDWILQLPKFANFKFVRGEMATLLPTVKLGWHIDPHWFHKHCNRLHIPIITNQLCKQLWIKDSFHMEVGQLYELNNRVEHSAQNFGNIPRIHLIFDIINNDIWQQEIVVNKINPISMQGETHPVHFNL